MGPTACPQSPDTLLCPSCHQAGALCCSAAKLCQRPPSPSPREFPPLPGWVPGARCHRSCKRLMAVKGRTQTPGKVLRSPKHSRAPRLRHHRDPRRSRCIGFGVTVAPAGTFYSALLCKSCPCCQFRGPPFVADREGALLFRVLCHSGAGESRVQ